MAEKYFLEYNDTENIVHRLEISSTTYVGSTTEISGSVIMDYAETDDAIEAIRGKGLRVELEASTSLTFDDLYSEVDRTWSVVYKRDSIILFNGWLDSDGLFEDFVSDHWILSLSCVDGLGYLKDLSYVDSSGITFSGKQSLLEIVVNCLARTGVDQNINTNIDIYYEGLATTLDIMDNVYFNANRFVKDDNETIMSCDEVLRSVLEPFAACITTFEGEWYIYKPNQIFSDSTPTFFRYDNDGVSLAPTTKTVDIAYNLGSQVDSFFPHHCNANQRLENDKSIGAYRISYKYGLVQSLLSNILLENILGVIDEWSIDSFTNLTFNASNLGVDLETIADGSDVKNMTSDLISLSANDQLSYTYRYKVIENNKIGGFIDPGETQYKIILTDGLTTYYWNTSDWALFNVMLKTPIGNLGQVTSQTVNLTPLPIAGDLTFEIHTSIKDALATSTSVVHLQEVSISPIESNTNIKGEFHTFQREDNPSANIKDTKEVSNGDNPSDVYYGTIYKTDETTPTDFWFRKGVTESKALLQIMGEETLRLNAATKRLFSGSVFGYIPYLSLVNINNVTGKFMPIAYSYDTKANITEFEFKQIYGDELTDILYELTLDFGNTVKPTIKG